MLSTLQLTPTISIFLSVTPETAMHRIQIRNRKNEDLTPDDVAFLVQCHEDWAKTTPATVIIDTNERSVTDIVDMVYDILLL